MEDTQDLVKEVQRLTAGRLVDRRAVGRLDELKVRGGEVVTDELVDEGQSFADTILSEEIVKLGSRLIQHLTHPVGGQTRGLGLRRSSSFARPALHEAEGVPDLITEVTTLLAE